MSLGQERMYVVQGKSGQKQCLLLSENDDKLNLQQVRLDEISVVEKHELDVNKYFAGLEAELVEQIVKLNGNLGKGQYHDMVILRNLIIISQQLDWSKVDNATHKLAKVVDILFKLQKDYNNNSEYDNPGLYWERFVDSQKMMFKLENQIADSLQKYVLTKQESKEQEKQGIEFNEDDYILSQSSYMQQLPESGTISTQLKLVQYWEKNIIPKIYDFVKGSLQQYLIEDFFEQMRIPLRKGDQSKALEIAYIVCEKRLPDGAVVPDANHDWCTLNIEEIYTNQFVLCRIQDKDILYSKFLLKYKQLGLQYITGQIIGVD